MEYQVFHLGFWAISVVCCMPAAWLLLEVCAALWIARQDSDDTGDAAAATHPGRPSVDIFIPAHNEESVIGTTLGSLTDQMDSGDRLFVVADNCDDGTAEVAAAYGARVICRTDHERRGKGFALDYAMRSIEVDDSRILVIVDADCQVQPAALDRLVGKTVQTGRPVQANYEFTLPVSATPRNRVRQFAAVLKNQIRTRGLYRLGLPCLLTGSGMAFPSNTLRRMNLANDNTADDMQLSCDLVLQGEGPVYCEAAVVRSPLPSGSKAADLQRKRWIHGHLLCIARYLPRLLRKGLTSGCADVLCVALEVAIPPLSLVGFGLLCLGAVAGLAGLLGWGWGPLAMWCLPVAMFVLAVLLATYQATRQTFSWYTLFAIPGHFVRTLPIAMVFGLGRQKWAPTDRDARAGPLSPMPTAESHHTS